LQDKKLVHNSSEEVSLSRSRTAYDQNCLNYSNDVVINVPPTLPSLTQSDPTSNSDHVPSSESNNDELPPNELAEEQEGETVIDIQDDKEGNNTTQETEDHKP
jgi:hypothetical protein